MERLPVSVIVPTKNAEKTLEKCLVSIQKNNPAEIIMVDGVSSDKTLEIARKYSPLILSDKGKGASYAHQIGAEQATQRYIAYVDSDITLPEGALRSLLTELQDLDCVSMAAAIVPTSVSTYWERAIDWNARMLRARRQTGGLQATILIKDIVLKYGFDTDIIYGDDLDFVTRVQRDGNKVGISSIWVHHQHRASLRSMFKTRLNYSRATPRLMKKYGFIHAGFWPPLVAAYWTCV